MPCHKLCHIRGVYVFSAVIKHAGVIFVWDKLFGKSYSPDLPGSPGAPCPAIYMGLQTRKS